MTGRISPLVMGTRTRTRTRRKIRKETGQVFDRDSCHLNGASRLLLRRRCKRIWLTNRRRRSKLATAIQACIRISPNDRLGETTCRGTSQESGAATVYGNNSGSITGGPTKSLTTGACTDYLGNTSVANGKRTSASHTPHQNLHKYSEVFRRRQILRRKATTKTSSS